MDQAELFCTVCGVIAESNRQLKGGDIVRADTFQFKTGFEPPKAGEPILCPKSPSHYVYFRNKATSKAVAVDGRILHGGSA